MKLLIYGNRKQDEDIYVIDTPEQEEKAYRAIFKELDDYWQVYEDLKHLKSKICEACQKGLCRLCEDQESCACAEKGCPSNISKDWRAARWPSLYKKAKAGNFTAMKTLMTERRDFEYEEIRVQETKETK